MGRGVGVEVAGRLAIPGAGVVSRLRWSASDGRAGRGTEWAARTALETALAERARRGAGTLKGSDTFAAAAAVWLERVERMARLGQRSPGTVETYSRQLSAHVLPALGALRLGEVTTPLVDRFVTDVHEHVGPATGRRVGASSRA